MYHNLNHNQVFLQECVIFINISKYDITSGGKAAWTLKRLKSVNSFRSVLVRISSQFNEKKRNHQKLTLNT